jgi:hypothetical protein
MFPLFGENAHRESMLIFDGQLLTYPRPFALPVFLEVGTAPSVLQPCRRSAVRQPLKLSTIKRATCQRASVLSPFPSIL